MATSSMREVEVSASHSPPPNAYLLLPHTCPPQCGSLCSPGSLQVLLTTTPPIQSSTMLTQAASSLAWGPTTSTWLSLAPGLVDASPPSYFFCSGLFSKTAGHFPPLSQQHADFVVVLFPCNCPVISSHTSKPFTGHFSSLECSVFSVPHPLPS